MPKVKATTSSRLRTFINIFGSEVFSTDGEVLHCKVCDKNVVACKRSQVDQHVNTKAHAEGSKRTVNSKVHSTQLLKNMVEKSYCDKQQTFNRDICEAFIGADIPLQKMEHPKLRGFFKQYIPSFNLPSVPTIRGKLQEVYVECIRQIRKEIGDSYVYLIVDEASDCMNRYICNILIGSLNASEYHEPLLLSSTILQSVNGNSVAQAVNDALIILWPEKLQYNKVLLLLTDGAAYMKKMGASLKPLYPCMIHLTCLAHALHRVAETVRLLYPKVNLLISLTKQIFVKAPMRRQLFLERTSLPLPPSPVVTRWGTWLNCTVYHAENFEKMKDFILSLNASDATCIEQAHELFNDESLRVELLTIATKFSIIANCITKLETKGLTIFESLDIIENLKKSLEAIGGTGVTALSKLISCLEKNPGWDEIRNIRKSLDGEFSSLAHGFSNDMLLKMKFAPLTSADVERSFSAFKAFFRSNRCNLSAEHLQQHIVIHFNSRLVSKQK